MLFDFVFGIMKVETSEGGKGSGMKYKLFFSDIDGTLIDDKMTVSKENIEAVRAFKAAGGQFVLCTGRLAASSANYVKLLGLDDQAITTVGLQGASAVTCFGEVIQRATIDADTAYEIVKRAEDDGTYCHIYNEKSVFISKFHPINIKYREYTGADLIEVGTLSKYIRAHRFTPFKVMTVIEPGSEARYFELFKDIQNVKKIMSSAEYFEFIAMDAGKGEGLKKAAAYLNADIKDTIAVGDNMNDVEMIQTAGLGFAVKNATKSAKDAAKKVTESDNNHSAIAEIIHRYCL